MKKFKRIVATILSLGMVMAGSLTSLAAELPAQNSKGSASIESNGQASDVFPAGTYEIRGNGVRIRNAPSLNGKVVSLLYENNLDWVTISGTKTDANDKRWCEVTNSSTGYKGWISQEFLKTPIK